MSENGYRAAGPHAYSSAHGPGSQYFVSGIGCPRPPLRRRVLRGRDLDRRLLPPDLHGEDAEAGELPVLRQRSAGGARPLPSVPALPTRARAGQRARRRFTTHRAAHRRTPRRRLDRQRRRPRSDCEPVRAELAADSPHRAQGARRGAGAAAAYQAFVAGETTAHRDRTAGDGDRVREWLLQLASLQRRLQLALRTGADALT